MMTRNVMSQTRQINQTPGVLTEDVRYTNTIKLYTLERCQLWLSQCTHNSLILEIYIHVYSRYYLLSVPCNKENFLNKGTELVDTIKN
jgi:hypothetical protein